MLRLQSGTDFSPESYNIWWPQVTSKVDEFRARRDWTNDDSPRNLLLALMGEVGELAETLQFVSDKRTSVSIQKYWSIAMEIADVTIYCIALQCYYHRMGKSTFVVVHDSNNEVSNGTTEAEGQADISLPGGKKTDSGHAVAEVTQRAEKAPTNTKGVNEGSEDVAGL